MNNKFNLTVLLVLVLVVFTSCQKETTMLDQEASSSTNDISQLKVQLEEQGIIAENISEIMADISSDVSNTTAAKALCTDATGEVLTSTIMQF